jgi:transcriptional regulator GlxA family with amidase domain
MLKKKSGSLLYELHENQVLYLGTDEPCEYYCSQQANWKFYFIRYSNTAILDEFQFKREVVYSIANRQRAIHLCENMISQLVHRAPGCLYRVQASFFELISMIASEQQGMNAVVNPNIARVIEWMHRNIDKSIRIEQFVRQSRMSRNQFFLSFKDFTGMSPMDYFIKLKLDSAKLALESTTRTVRSIAESLHFCDAYYLSKLFKKHFGMSPAVYRNSVRKEE